MSATGFEDGLDELGRGLVRAVDGPTRAVHQARGSSLYIALHPLIAGGTADIVSGAQFREGEEVVEVIGDESSTLVHG